MKAINNNENLITYKVIKTIFNILFLFMLLFICSLVCKDKVAYVVTLSFLYRGEYIEIRINWTSEKYVEEETNFLFYLKLRL